MDKLVIHGGRPLRGQIRVSGSKNAALPILMATLLCDTPARVSNAPVSLRDIRTTLRLLDILGCRTGMDAAPSGPVVVVERNGLKPEAPYDLVKTMRASVLCLGPLLALLGEAKVALPGGCAIGARPVDQHLKGFEALGARFDLDSGYVHGTCSRLRGTRFAFDFPTVGGVENLLMAAVLAEGETVLENCAREPEIVDLANFLIACGARITGAGTDVIHVQGVSSLSGCDYRIMPDRIEAGTYLVAAAITDGELRLSDCPMDVLDSVVLKLGAMSVAVEREGDDVVVKRSCAPRCPTRCVDVTTRPFPGFPTDMQAQIMALMAVSEGAGVIEETIFENRFMHVQELARMGADITLKGRSAMIRGVKTLRGAPVMASDLRASASLVLAGLAAKGTTEVQRIYHLDRGYERMEEKLSQVGAAIERAPE